MDLAGDRDNVDLGVVFYSGEEVEQVFTFVLQEEVDFVEDYYCVDGSGSFFDLALKC